MFTKLEKTNFKAFLCVLEGIENISAETTANGTQILHISGSEKACKLFEQATEANEFWTAGWQVYYNR